VSYILDALTKAALQRDRRIPVVQRLLAPAARMPRSPRALSRVVVALAVNAGLLMVLLVWWLRPMSEPPVAEPTRSAAAPARSATAESPRAVAEPPRPTIAEPPRPVVEPPPRSVPRAEKPSPVGRSAAASPPAPAIVPQAPPPVPVPAPQRPVPLPQFPSIGNTPLTPGAPAMPSSTNRPLKLEALIFSDVPSQRMVFINGRRYVEGDMVEGRLRVEEIHEDGVDLSEQGRRTTLRATR